MPYPTSRPHEWAKAPTAVALAVTALGALPAMIWGVVAGLWTFSTQDYGSFFGVLLIMAFLIGTPLAAFKAALGGKPRFALALTAPALSLYVVTALVGFGH